MKLLFINAIMQSDWSRLHMLSLVLLIFYLGVITAVLIDLFFGVRKAKKQGIARTSYGFRRTIEKLTGYLGLMMLLTIADVVASMILTMPYLTFLGAIGIIIVEVISVYENIKSQNREVEKIPAVLIELIKNKDNLDDLLSRLNEHYKNIKNETKQ